MPAPSAAEKVAILTTGGTFDKYYSVAGEMEIDEPTVGPILDLAATNLDTEVRSVVAIDSLDMTDEHRAQIAEALEETDARRVVITHGTDTMPETSEFLRERPEAIKGKTIVLTGAMQPSCMRLTDAPFNLGAAVAAAQLLEPGVYISMSGRIFEAGSVAKDRSRGVFVAK
ncbi:asparaginase domain-containing protein [Kocuria sp. HSID16901]|uniref:asparaginase domain-containing protein n=1 Tax=Kocuria sp. HSID16901 TaxID=2419505 RepID=UPI0006609186|nr:asparaginase domain-containing protein [Kocuria sp. HSID16901]MCT1367676.1 asparaginase domain-containing protein [Rothia sp. p3-SID1597]RUQ20237.1 L-asparaginase [Kocuria sp. HSID16901]